MSEELANRVMQVVNESRYVPHGVARNLSRGKSGLIGLLVSDIANPFAGQVARGLEDEASRHGYHVLVGSSDFDLQRESELLNSFAARTVDAVVSLSARQGRTDSMIKLIQTQIPVIFVDKRPSGGSKSPAIITDNLSAAHDAVRYLIDLGHQDLAMLSGPEDMPTAMQRLEGFRNACDEAGIAVRPECIRAGFVGTGGGYEAMREILSLKQVPTAVFSFNNMLAVGALRALRERHVSIPEELSLVTFDDMELFPYVDPPITAIAQPAYRIGVEAGRVVFSLLSGDGSTPTEILLPTEFRRRGSCAAPRTGPLGKHSASGSE